MVVRVTVPEGCILVVRSNEWSHCGFVPKYRIVRGPCEVETDSATLQGWQEMLTLLRPGESTEAAEAENAPDWSGQEYKAVRITNEDGEAKIEILDQGRLERID